MTIKTTIIGNLKNIMSKWFYTEDEVNTLLNGKSDSNHNHDSRYYLKTEVDAIEDTLRLAIESLVGFTASIVESLPQTGSSGVMYLVPNDGGVEQDYYTEYIWTDEGKFEKIGNTAVEVDLSGYATISFVNSALADYVTSDELEGLLAGKADVVHTHSISDVSGLQSSLDGKAGNSVASSSANGLMSSTDKVKLDGVEEGANNVTVDSSMSSSSTNPVQNKVVKAELDSLNNNKANTSHTHNDNSGVIEVDCSYGDVYKFKKNGWAVVVWQNLDLTSVNTGSWTTLAQTGWSNTLASVNFYGNFIHKEGTAGFTVSPTGNLRVNKYIGADNTGHYGYIIYPTTD